MRLRSLASTVSALAIATVPALAAAPPRSFQPVITPGGSGTSAPLTMPDGAGQPATLGVIDSVRHLFTVPFASNEINVSAYGPAADGVTDDLAAYNRAAATVPSTNVGGRITLDPRRRYLIDSGNLVVPPYTALDCKLPTPGQRPGPQGGDFSAAPGIVLNSNYSIVLSQGSVIQNCLVMRKGLVPPDGSVRTNINIVAAFAGTAIIANGPASDGTQKPTQGTDSGVENVLVVGFNQCFSSSGQIRPFLRHFRGDCTNGPFIDNAHDIPHLLDVHLWPFLTGNTLYQSTTATITGAANNGSGLYRISTGGIPALETPIVGDKVYVQATGGANGAMGGPWTVSAINGSSTGTTTTTGTNTFDLQGSAFAPTFTASMNNGGYYLASLSSTANLNIGQTVSGSGIPAGTTITGVWAGGLAVTLSQPVTQTASNVTVTVTNPAFTSGGKLMMDTNFRTGYGLAITNSETTQVVDFFSYGHLICAYTSNAVWTTFTNANCDNEYATQNPSIIGLMVDGTAIGNGAVGGGVNWQGGSFSGVGRAFVVNQPQEGSASVGLTVSDTSINTIYNGMQGVALDLLNYKATLVGNNTTTTSNIFMQQSTALFMAANFMPYTRVVTVGSPATRQNIYQSTDNRVGDAEEFSLINLTGCGTNPVLMTGGNRHYGNVVEGTNASGCVVNFPLTLSGETTYGSVPACAISYYESAVWSGGGTINGITTAHQQANNRQFSYVCQGR